MPEWSARDLEIISGLRELGDTAAPDAATRDRIRTEVQRRLAERERRAPNRRRRVLAEVLAAAVALVVALGGLGLVLSKNAVPGDTLYGIKRAGESAQLGLTFGDAAKAEKHLEFASNRLDELASLRDGDASRYAAALADFRTEATEGTAQLTTLAVQGGGQLTQLRTWAQQQREKLVGIAPTVPTGALPDYNSSMVLVGRIEARAQQLDARLGCYQITTGQPDDLGAVPDSSACHSGPADGAAAGRSGVPLPLPAPRSAQQVAPVTTTGPDAPAASVPTGPVAPSGGVSAPPVISAPITAPTSPRTTPTSTAPAPPLISIPPLLPGLPGVGIG